jgi:hypothetical protein
VRGKSKHWKWVYFLLYAWSTLPYSGCVITLGWTSSSKANEKLHVNSDRCSFLTDPHGHGGSLHKQVSTEIKPSSIRCNKTRVCNVGSCRWLQTFRRNVLPPLSGPMHVLFMLILFISMGWDCVSELRPPAGLLLSSRWAWRATVELYWQEKTKEYGKEPCPSATLSTTNPTWTDPGSHPGLRDEKPATESWRCLSTLNVEAVYFSRS